MQSNTYKDLTDDKLLKRRELMKGISIGFGAMIVLAIAAVAYLFIAKGNERISVAVFIPVLMLPVICMPLLINWSLLNKEIKARSL